MEYMEMFKVVYRKKFWGYLICAVSGNYLYKTSDTSYIPLCNGAYDKSSIKKRCTYIYVLKEEVIENIKYCNRVRVESIN